MFKRRSRFNRYRFPAWIKGFIDGVEFVVLPLLIFQMFRTFFWPTTFDVFILFILGGIYFIFLKGWI